MRLQAAEWQTEALCRDSPSSVFVPDDLRKAVPELVGLLCPNCPVRQACEAYGRSTASSGWWGGVLLREGMTLRRQGRHRQRRMLPKRVRLTWDDAETIRRRYAEGGVFQRELADEYGISRLTALRIINGQMWTVPPQIKPRRVSDEVAAEIRRRYAEGGVTQYQLADEYGITQSYVSDIVGRLTERSVACL